MKPILFNTDMVRAILEGRKTVTRRVVKPQPKKDNDGMWNWKDCHWMDGGIGFPDSGIEDYAPYRPGDILYVRETWRKWVGGYSYRADAPEWACQWRPSIHMPREAARIFLRVTDVRVERLRDMRLVDFLAEGVRLTSAEEWDCIHGPLRARERYAGVWDSTIKPADCALYGWDANPWVWVIEFERISKEECLRAEMEE